MIHRLQAAQGLEWRRKCLEERIVGGPSASVGRLGAHPAVGLSAQGGRDGTEFERRQNENSR